MTKEDKLLQLVLSDMNLSTLYQYKATDYPNISVALRSDNPVVQVVARIIRGIKKGADKNDYKSLYNALFNYLHTNIK